MKKIISILLITATLLALLTGCDMFAGLNEDSEPIHVPPSPNPDDTGENTDGNEDEKKEEVFIEVESVDTTHGGERIYVIWHNNSENMLVTASYYEIEYKNGNEWETLTPSDDAYFSDLVCTVEEDSERKVAYRVDVFDMSRKGTYRICIGYGMTMLGESVNYRHLYAEFDLEALPAYEGHAINVKGDEFLYEPLPENCLDGESVSIKLKPETEKVGYLLVVNGKIKDLRWSADSTHRLFSFTMPDYDVNVEIKSFELTGEFPEEEELIRTYFYQNPKIEWVKIKHYYSTKSDGAVVVMLEDSDDKFEAKRWDEDIGRYNFRYADTNRITVFRKGKFMTLTEYGTGKNSIAMDEKIHRTLYAHLYNDNFGWQIVKTSLRNYHDFYNDKINKTVIINSFEELNEYYEKNKNVFYFGSVDKVYADSTIGFVDAIKKYDEEFFKSRSLVFVIGQTCSSDLNNIQVKSVRNFEKNGERMLAIKMRNGAMPPYATADVIFRHVIIEIDKSMTVSDANHIIRE